MKNPPKRDIPGCLRIPILPQFLRCRKNLQLVCFHLIPLESSLMCMTEHNVGIIMAFCMAQICCGVGKLLQDKVSCLQYCVQNYSKIHDSDDSVCFSPKTSIDKPFFSIAQHMTFLHVRNLRSCTRFQVPAQMTCCRPEKDLLLLFWNAASTAANAYCKTRMSILPYPQSL